MSSNLPPGSRLDHYEIKSLLGAGGMGEVYLAQDTKLDRQVALKILPGAVAAHSDRMKRFVHEARAASALNHPNIITIYEIDQTGSVPFMATEFIDGVTLRARLRQAPLKLNEVLDIATQIASALSAAHTAGIVHRDIKPENVMLRRDGIVKVLDFGLAKLSERIPTDSVDTEAPTRVDVKTEPGVVMGTAIYMSPEQARGLEVDARTDIFTLGIVLYEMVAGCLPFAGSSSSEVLASILGEKEPQPLARYSSEAPVELERIVSKALRKDREQRYQATKDMLLDLQDLKQQLDFEAKLERSISPRTENGKRTVYAPSSTLSGNQAITTRRNELPGTGHSKKILIIILTLLVLAAAGIVYRSYFGRRPAKAIDSIAILPLINASNDPNAEYLSDGITESIISNLSQLPQLKVMARSTVFHFKGKEIDPREVGRQLGVQAVMAGRLLRQGNQLIVRTELINVEDGTQLWGAEYDRSLSDVLALQQDISREISERLRLRLTGEDKKRLTGHDTVNAEAYQFYLRGRYHWNKRNGDALTKAIEEFQQAIDHDPNYALGYVGLADSYLVLEQVAGIPASDTLPKAKIAADRALQLDDSLAEAHTSSAQINQHLWRWPEAEAEFKRANSLNPNYPTAHQWYSFYLKTRLRFDDALREVKRAQELDPLSPIISSNVAFVFYLKGDFDAAIDLGKKVIALDPEFPIAHSDLAWSYLKLRRYEDATAEFQKATELSSRASLLLGNLGHCYGVTGKRSEALTIAKELEERYARREAIGFFVASVYAGLGDKDQAFAWLEKDFEQHSALLPGILWWPNFESLRGDPRYADLVRRMGLQT